MALNVTTAVFAENCNTATASPSLAQWDTEQVLQISGIELPDSYKVEFSTVYTRNAIPAIGDASGVTIPNVLLQRSAPITAYIVLYGENGGRNREYWITIYITPGQPPETITPDPEQEDVIDQAIAALNSGVARTEAAATSAEGSARDAEAAAEAVQNLSVAAETLATGEPASVEKTVDPETGTVTLNFGLPKGNTGATGPRGETGERGEKGDPAVVYTLEPTVSAISYDPNASFAWASITVNAYRTTGQGARESFTAQEFHLLVGTASQTIARQDVLNASSATLIIPSTATPDMHVTGYISAWVNNQRVTLATVEVPFIREGLDGTDGETVRPYIIEASAGAITYNPNATAGSRVSPATVTFNVYRGNVDGTRTVQTVDTIIAFFAQADGTEIVGRIITDASSLTINSPQELPVGSYLLCRISDGSTVLRELRIPVIHDGVDGADGASDAERVTYDPTATYTSGTAGAALNDLSRQLNDETTGLDTKAPVIINTASGAIASFNDGADYMPIKKLVAQIEPVQDLHGQESPYPAGGGKNLVNIADSTAPITSQTTISDNFTLPAGTYILSADVNNTGAGGFKINLRSVLGSVNSEIDTVTSSEGWARKSSPIITLPEDDTVYLYCSGTVSGYSGNYKNIMLCKSTATDPTVFAPYENICPISGWTGVEIEQAGKNLLKLSESEMESAGWTRSFPIAVKAGTYILSCENKFGKDGSEGASIAFADENGNTIGNALSAYAFGDSVFVGTAQTFTADQVAKIKKIKFSMRAGNTTFAEIAKGNIQLELGSTVTTYHPYTGNQISVNWEDEGGTVYGGTLTLNPDRTGTLVADRAIADMGALPWNVYASSAFTLFYAQISGMREGNGLDGICSAYPMLIGSYYSWMNLKDKQSIFYYGGGDSRIGVRDSSYANLSEFVTSVTGQTCVYPLANTQTFQLTAEQVSGILTTIYGTNNVWADTGDVEVTYPADTKLYIDNKITQAIANALNS